MPETLLENFEKLIPIKINFKEFSLLQLFIFDLKFTVKISSLNFAIKLLNLFFARKFKLTCFYCFGKKKYSFTLLNCIFKTFSNQLNIRSAL